MTANTSYIRPRYRLRLHIQKHPFTLVILAAIFTQIYIRDEESGSKDKRGRKTLPVKVHKIIVTITFQRLEMSKKEMLVLTLQL